MSRLSVGARAEIRRGGALPPLPAEVVGFRETRALLMPFGPVEGVAPGAEITHYARRRRRPAHRRRGAAASSTPSVSRSTG